MRLRENHKRNMVLFEEIKLSNNRRIPSLTPCAGRCSTVFGDAVCRGCRRFNHEVIQWNTYHEQHRHLIWQRLDAQLDQILVPMLPLADLKHVEGFVLSKRVRLLPDASKGRKLYHALKLCEKNRHFTDESGLAIHYRDVRPLWDEFERRILALATASYELAFLRADVISLHLLQQKPDSTD